MDEKNICKLYEKGESIREISKNSNYSYEKILEILMDNDFIIRQESGNLRIFTRKEMDKLIELNNKNYGYNYMAKEFNCNWETVKKIMKRNNIVKNRTTLKNHNIKSDYFSNINTEEKAYFIGLLLTDGSIRQDNIRLSLKREDEYMVKKFKDALNSDVQIQLDNREGKEASGVEINCKQAVEDLKKYNIVPNKTYLINNINIELIPENLRRHYIRGLIDGDGTIYLENYKTGVQPAIGFCAYSEDCVKSLQCFIDKEVFNTEMHNNIKKDNAYNCRWKGTNKCSQIFHYLYDDATIYLTRKYDIAKAYL